MKTNKNYKSEILDIIRTKDWDRARYCNAISLYRYIKRHKDTDENCKIIWEHIKSRDFESEVLEIVETKNWDRAKQSNDENLYHYVYCHKNTNENCRIIWEYIRSRDYKSEILDIIKTKDWNRAKKSNDGSLYQYIYHHKDTDENCRTIWKHISQQGRDYELEILDIVETKDWDRAKKSNDENLYLYICRHKDTDENCKIIWEHIKTETRNYKSEISDIIRTKDWNRAKYYNDKNLYLYICRHKDIDENCRIICEHIVTEKHCPYTVKDYLLGYFKHGKLENESLYNWFTREIRNGNQSCIDIKNLIIASEIYKDPVALETLKLIKNHLEKEGT